MGAMIDRDLAARDLEALASLVSPAIEARLETLRSVPIVGPRLLSLLAGSPAQMTSAALASVLELPDEDLAALADMVARELGAWRGFLPPVTPGEAEALRPALARLEGALR